ncbi:hypothetical protein ACFQ51_57025, partial [Streptomyces kaempferi]
HSRTDAVRRRPRRRAEPHRLPLPHRQPAQHLDGRPRPLLRHLRNLRRIGGVPCTTMRGLARFWRTHPDYVPAWNQNIDDPACRSNIYKDYKKRTTIYQERKASLDAFYDRFDLEEAEGGERWRCKTCGAHGETWKPVPGAYDYPHAIGAAEHRHPTCPEGITT